MVRLATLAVSFAALSYTTVAQAAPSAFDAQMAPLAGDLIAMDETLAADKYDGVAARAAAIAKQAASLDEKGIPAADAGKLKGLGKKIGDAAAAVAAAKDIETARTALKELSKPFALWATLTKPSGVIVVFCPHANASWLQKAGPVRNPYMGAKMLACGDVVGGDVK